MRKRIIAFRDNVTEIAKRLEPLVLLIGLIVTQYGLAIIFGGFGALKVYLVFMGTPGPPIVLATGEALQWIPGVPDPPLFVLLVGVWEVVIGVCFATRRYVRFGIVQLLPHQPATFVPFLVIPDITFSLFPFPSFAGLYIIKNFAIVGAALLLWVLYPRWQDGTLYKLNDRGGGRAADNRHKR